MAVSSNAPLPGPEVFERAAALAQALSSPARLRLLNVLGQSPRSVDALARRLQQSTATTSAQLKVLARVGLVRREARGQRAVYSVANDASARLWLGLRDHALEASTDLQQRAEALAPAYGSDLEGLTDRVAARRLCLLDLRPEEEWRAGHLPGARNVPFEVLSSTLGQLPRSKPYVVYCTGPLCSKAIQGTRLMREDGLRATRLPSGVVEWTHAGRALEVEQETNA